ncbi:MAG: hypothetical protein U9R68_03585 [Planctomycetota bacterium]|nr:hypothetical protein [Planctomycetota bacterium]
MVSVKRRDSRHAPARGPVAEELADRVEPFVKILVGYCHGYAKTPPEQRPWGRPDTMEPNYKPQPPKKDKDKGKKQSEKASRQKDRTGKKRRPETSGNIKPL